MADGSLTIQLDEYAARKLSEKAEATGLSREAIVEMLVGNALFDYDDFVWSNGDPRDDHASNYDLNETGRLWSDVRPEVVALLKRKLAERP